MANADEVPHGWLYGQVCRISDTWEHDGFNGFHRGELVKVVMVSRFGDCGLTKNLQAEYGYDVRVAPRELVPVNQRPAHVCADCNYVKGIHDGGVCPKPWDLTEA